MRSYKASIITAVITALIAIAAFLIIYRDITDVPKFKGTFVFCEGVVRI